MLYCGICHSGIHQARDEWTAAPTPYPCVPGHEIGGGVIAVGVDPGVGDITYYAPWSNLAIFYRDFGYSTGLIKLGRFDAGIEAFEVRGPLNVRIEVLGK